MRRPSQRPSIASIVSTVSTVALSIAMFAAAAVSTMSTVSAATPSASTAPPSSVRTQAARDIDLTGYKLTFSDEFDRLSVSTRSPKGAATWFYIPPYGPAGNYSASYWDVAALSAANSALSIKVLKDPAGKWRSGNLSSMDGTGHGFSQRYGYFEVRARMPRSGTGSWPAFWLMSSTSIDHTSNYASEIDIFEWYGKAYSDNAAVISQASHNWASDGSRITGQQLYSPLTPMPNGAKPWEDFHIYGCQIDPVHITWYIDGVQTNQMPTSGAIDYMKGPYYIMIDYALGGGWPLSGVVEGSSFDIDWVRVYSLPERWDTVSVRPAT